MWRDLRQILVMLGIPALILWLGGNAISHISELYDGLCPVQGPGLASLLYDDNPKGYCTGIGTDLSILGLIMGVAVLAVPVALRLIWDLKRE